MINIWIVIMALFFMPLIGTAENSLEYDSVGVSEVNSRLYIIHQVEQGETLYSISRKYGVSVDDILKANPGMGKNLKIDMTIFIPYSQQKEQASVNKRSGVAFHVVKPSETLYSISRQYGVTVSDIKKWNNLKDNTLSPGTKLAIGNAASNGKVVDAGGGTDFSAGERDIHIVKQKETLYNISRKYGVSVEQVKEWNHLTGNELKIGQKLVVSPPAGSTAAQKGTGETNSSMLPVGTTIEEKTNPEEIISKDSQVKEVDSKVDKQQGETVAAIPDENEEDDKNYEPAEKTIEKGMAEVIGDASDSRKYLALHRTAPIGTIMQIKNEMNDQIVFVRVVGRIQDTGDNDKVLVMISKKAYERLGALDNRFPVVISYVK